MHNDFNIKNAHCCAFFILLDPDVNTSYLKLLPKKNSYKLLNLQEY